MIAHRAPNAPTISALSVSLPEKNTTLNKRGGNHRAKNKVVIIRLRTTTFFQQPAMFLLHGNPTLPSQSLWLINVNHPLKKNSAGGKGAGQSPKNILSDLGGVCIGVWRSSSEPCLKTATKNPS